jgi:murein DD-endopeptidase MepM/ murein hydrolase activator NlpD
MPIEWLPSRGRECGRHGKRRRFCQGPRRVPAPHGPEAELAAQLELGTNKTVSHLILEAPRPEWVYAAGLEDPEKLLWPVDAGMLWRGLSRAQRARPAAKLKARPAHKGLDIGAPEGSPIRAVQSGIVAYADNGVRGYGNLLVTVHPDNSAAFYAHCRAVYVFPGQYIVRGQVVAEVGQTGITRGPHLHFEYRKNGRVRDPLRLFEAKPTS